MTWLRADAGAVAGGAAATHRGDPDRWRPLIMSFAEFYGLANGRVHRSELAEIPQSAYPRAGAHAAAASSVSR
jgi:hypothetical protein